MNGYVWVKEDLRKGAVGRWDTSINVLSGMPLLVYQNFLKRKEKKDISL